MTCSCLLAAALDGERVAFGVSATGNFSCRVVTCEKLAQLQIPQSSPCHSSLYLFPSLPSCGGTGASRSERSGLVCSPSPGQQERDTLLALHEQSRYKTFPLGAKTFLAEVLEAPSASVLHVLMELSAGARLTQWKRDGDFLGLGGKMLWTQAKMAGRAGWRRSLSSSSLPAAAWLGLGREKQHGWGGGTS